MALRAFLESDFDKSEASEINEIKVDVLTFSSL